MPEVTQHPEEPLIDIIELAARLKTTRSALYQRVHRGQIPARRLGVGTLRFLWSEVLASMAVHVP